MNVCICGGGNLGHVMAAYLSGKTDARVSVLTRRPEAWNMVLYATEPDGEVFSGELSCVSADPAEVVSDADMVFVCLPGFAIRDELQKIKPYLKDGAAVGSVVSNSGFFFEALEILEERTTLFGFQRVPFISRIKEYGKSCELKGYKTSLSVAVERSSDKLSIVKTLEGFFRIPVKLLGSHYEASLSNSNPLLHPARLYTMWGGWQPGMVYEHNPMFYEEWDNRASELLIAMDNEFMHLLDVLGIKEHGTITPILEYYDSWDVASLTAKITSIRAFKGIMSPMLQTDTGFVPDFHSRYFTEDIPYGMRFIVETAAANGVSIPVISKVYAWGTECIDKF